ncbi:MAG TPA: ATP-binding protein [Tahibacter sp.]|nr:ATP-binding protein [Tahibacter sp.]
MTRAEDLFRRIQQDGLTAIDRLVDDVASEELFLDFKRTSDNRVSPKLPEGDAKILSKAISGFGNSEGGVIIWGIDRRTDRDGNQQIQRIPLVDAPGFRANIESAISRLTIPVHPGVQSVEVLGDAPPSGYVATYIPQASFSPIRAIAQGSDRYYIRAGDSFVPTPHGVLEAQFGRRPLGTAWVQLYGMPVGLQSGSEAISIAFGIGCANGGSTLLEHAYMSVHPKNGLSANILRVSPAYDPQRLHREQTDIEIQKSVTGNWQVHVLSGRVIAPGGIYDLAIVSFAILNPALQFNEGLSIDVVVGASSVAPIRFGIECTGESASEALAQLRATRQQFSSGDLFSFNELTEKLKHLS